MNLRVHADCGLPGASAPFAELRELRATAIPTAQPAFRDGQLLCLALSPSTPMPVPMPLLEGTEEFTSDAVIGWHCSSWVDRSRDIACYFAANAIVTGPGHIWIDGRLVTSSELMPLYVYNVHDIAKNGASLLAAHSLPLREIASPCVVLLGHGLHVYGHFFIELLFRVLLARRALRGPGLAPRWLMDADAPGWLMRILHEDLGIPQEDIEFFRPADERVRLRRAILPSLLYDRGGTDRSAVFHPVAGELIDELLTTLPPLPKVPAAPRLFISRRGFRNDHSPYRECRNEATLAELAAARNFVVVNPEALPWRQQLALLRNADILVGLWGSALHASLVAPPGTRIGVVGLRNMVQSAIASLRGHRIAYLTNGFEMEGQFTVPEDEFEAFLGRVCAPETSG